MQGERNNLEWQAEAEALVTRYLRERDPAFRLELEVFLTPTVEALVRQLARASGEPPGILLQVAEAGLRSGIESYRPEFPSTLPEHALRAALGAVKYYMGQRGWGAAEESTSPAE